MEVVKALVSHSFGIGSSCKTDNIELHKPDHVLE